MNHFDWSDLSPAWLRTPVTTTPWNLSVVEALR